MPFLNYFTDLPLGICVVTRTRKAIDIIDANPRMYEMLGLGTKAALKGKSFSSIFKGAETTKLVKKLKSVTPPESYILPLDAPDTKKVKNKKDDSACKWLKLNIARSTYEDRPCYIICADDVSETMKAESALKAEVEKADAAAEMKSNFLATMSHEIRTPMQSIFGLLELINEEDPPENIQKMADTAKNSASGLLEILDDILDLAKMDAEKMELDIFEVPVRLLVRGTLEAMSVKTQTGRVQLIDDILQEVPFVVIGDPKRLRQIITNLVGNALKFTDSGTVTVRVSPQTQEIKIPKGQIGLRFEVIDTGIGMSKEVCNRLFRSFAQADNSTARKYGGTGLGLSISKKLVTLMGGEIGVESHEGKGSTFWFEIPTEAVDTDKTTIQLPDLEGISVLSIEDHPMGAKEIRNSLRSMGANVESCGTLEEGRALIARRPFDVAVIDNNLPDGLGLDLLREVSATHPDMGLIMYTVMDDSSLRHTLTALGAKHLTKPASRAGLGDAVKDVARHVATERFDGPQRLLIAEDTQSVREILSRQLASLGVEAEFVLNGQEALDALASNDFGILITDLHMPEVDGYALVKTIRDKEKAKTQKDKAVPSKHIPVIVMTADVQMAQRDVYMDYGFDECLLKPVTLGQMKRLLVRWGVLDLSTAPQKTAPANVAESKPAISNDTPPIDIEGLKEMMGTDESGAKDMLGMFVNMTESSIHKVKVAFEEKDYNALKEHAHSLKGAAYSACCKPLGDVAANLQDEAEKKSAACEQLVSDAVNAFEDVKKAANNL